MASRRHLNTDMENISELVGHSTSTPSRSRHHGDNNPNGKSDGFY